MAAVSHQSQGSCLCLSWEPGQHKERAEHPPGADKQQIPTSSRGSPSSLHLKAYSKHTASPFCLPKPLCFISQLLCLVQSHQLSQSSKFHMGTFNLSWAGALCMLKQRECCRAEQPPPSPRNQRCHRLSVHSEPPVMLLQGALKNTINPKHTSEEQAQRRLLLQRIQQVFSSLGQLKLVSRAGWDCAHLCRTSPTHPVL